MSNYYIKAKNKKTGEIEDVTVIDRPYMRTNMYSIQGEEDLLEERQFNELYEPVEEQLTTSHKDSDITKITPPKGLSHEELIEWGAKDFDNRFTGVMKDLSEEETHLKVEADLGHEKLIEDLENLLQEAKDFEFHDFKNEKYPAPKYALVNYLEIIITHAKHGRYDNQ